MAISKEFQLTGTSPSSAITTVLATQNNLDQYTECNLHALLQGATGGTLDVYLQCSNNWRFGTKDETGDYTALGSPTWYDVVHFSQLAAAAAAIRYNITLARGYPNATTINVVNVADGTPTLAVNTALPNSWGAAIRMVVVAGAGTTLGSIQTVNAVCSDG